MQMHTTLLSRGFLQPQDVAETPWGQGEGGSQGNCLVKRLDWSHNA